MLAWLIGLVMAAGTSGGMKDLPQAGNQHVSDPRVRALDLDRQADELMAKEQFSAALPLYREVIALRSSVNKQYLVAPYIEGRPAGLLALAWVDLARCYVALEKSDLARDAYRHAFPWNPEKGVLGLVVPSGFQLLGEYSRFLLKAGRPEEAKDIFHYALTMLEGERNKFEPMPLDVIFEASDQGDSWELTTENFDAAWLALAAVGDNNHMMAKKAHDARPDWYFPALYLGLKERDSVKKNELIDLAVELAPSELIRQRVRKVAGLTQDQGIVVPTGQEVRSQMLVLNQTTAQIKANPGRLFFVE